MTKSSPDGAISAFTKLTFVLFIVTVPATALGGAIVDNPERPTIRYSIEPSVQPCVPLSEETTNTTDAQSGPERVGARNYTELSPEAQKIFRLALQADEEYTTRRAPDDLAIQTDYPKPNHILYSSECFVLTGQSTRDMNAPFHAGLFRLFGGVLAVIFGGASAGSFLWGIARQRREET